MHVVHQQAINLGCIGQHGDLLKIHVLKSTRQDRMRHIDRSHLNQRRLEFERGCRRSGTISRFRESRHRDCAFGGKVGGPLVRAGCAAEIKVQEPK